ncbi:hypothetical protein AXI76_gp131 [Pseudoalteromonas phage H101]|uniref:Uncharacterized protein n=1 Tax=Pseudoalteromonas phage H101 TaxID=1654919 RepID=A0A0H4INY7_9CAUD|nr:hypothetical protein AXI76_gp131 [Pseudoalteromonas phage H101]AKO61032.1 hypothetical protein [Pseudoalteromonas phage H101]|tara:strand:- start:2702 stop:2836 length:135 start_codon:yes stop_codon:yes gene_type:complete
MSDTTRIKIFLITVNLMVKVLPKEYRNKTFIKNMVDIGWIKLYE